jgi:nucleotide-binding universal stress UspA family protein
MFQLSRILFPVDFSERSRGAAAYVESLVGRFEAELVLLHVIEATYNGTLDDLPETEKQRLDGFFGRGLHHLRVTKLVDHGEPAQKIIQCASARNVDLIMIPTQGMGVYRRLILGSTSAKVLHDADCPVWTGVHLENAPPLEAVSCERIVCAVDLKPASARVLEWANHLAEEYQAELTLVHVRSGSETYDAGKAVRKSLERLRSEVGAQAAIRVEGGDVPRVVAHLARAPKKKAETNLGRPEKPR